ncbi:NAD(P)H-dependent oxidoreductase [Marixanthomonas sp. SCSIO 43207]|uniref:NAD(P)H-dependent oxidoreductase n=1 Tax=Marixanthomonas sp. SCSIO 43207 TaxID=2779360 RepID=UPI001CAA3E75|nr:NAD(P)H-dependent oxidoreductase [Marixanthomonas sp. SCSIO 43207]UAB80935.1 NAD(P)H-dependent oxidoreductase [Marixanthomonas sp. SCSIO 43207]
MKNVFIINGHQEYPFAQGKLNASFTEKAETFFKDNGYNVKTIKTEDETYNVEEEIEKWKWADVVFFQTPINWMGQSWSFKKYIDQVFTQGMMGEMSDGDGRSSSSPKKNYGLGGKLKGKYMMSVTANAPKEAFNNPEESFFGGMSEDDLLKPMHLNFKWFGFEPMPTFMAYDVMKNPEIETDFKRFDTHLRNNFITL